MHTMNGAKIYFIPALDLEISNSNTIISVHFLYLLKAIIHLTGKHLIYFNKTLTN